MQVELSPATRSFCSGRLAPLTGHGCAVRCRSRSLPAGERCAHTSPATHQPSPENSRDFPVLGAAVSQVWPAELTWSSRRAGRVADVQNPHDPLQVCLESPSDRSTPAAILSRHPLVTNSLPRARRTQVLGRGAAESTRPIKESVHISTSALLQLVEAAGARIRRRFSHAVSTHVSFKCVRQNLIWCCAWSWAKCSRLCLLLCCMSAWEASGAVAGALRAIGCGERPRQLLGSVRA